MNFSFFKILFLSFSFKLGVCNKVVTDNNSLNKFKIISINNTLQLGEKKG